MDYQKLFEYAREAVTALISGWELKIPMATIFAVVELHMEIFSIFVLLVIMDCATKWIALARPLCAEPEIWEEIKAIPEAHRRGIISSETMKTRFIGKIVVYLICAGAAGWVDLILADLGKTAAAASLCIGYLAATELLSIIENLNDAGVSAVADLASLIKNLRKK